MRAHVTRTSKTIRSINRRAKGERRDWANPRDAHQPPAYLLPMDDIENLLGQAAKFAQHRCEDR
jgi:hypothetical protein